MRQTLTPRPALAAIAAVLALGSTSAMAQLADPAAAPAPAPVEAAPAAPIALPTVAPTTVTPTTTAPAPAPIIAPALPEVVTPAASPEAAQPETATRETAPAEEAAPVRRAEPTRSAPTREARAETPAPAPRAETPAPAEPLSEQPALSSTDIAAIQQTAPEAAPEPAPVAEANDDSQLYWALGAGGVLLAFGATAFAMSRRSGRRDAEAARTDEVITPTVTPAAEPMPVKPASWAPPRMPVAATGERFSDLEAMVAERPSAENPFVTRRKRLRRAEFLMNGGRAPEQAATPTEAQAPASAPREQPVYHFGGKQSFRPQGWKPATT